MVEFALVAPMFFMLLFGIIEVGRFIFYYEVLNNATREGARYAIVNGANSLTARPARRPRAPRRATRRATASCKVRRDTAFGVLGTSAAVDRGWYRRADRRDPRRQRRGAWSLSPDVHVLDAGIPRASARSSRVCGVEPCHQQLAGHRERGQVLVLFAGGLIVLLIDGRTGVRRRDRCSSSGATSRMPPTRPRLRVPVTCSAIRVRAIAALRSAALDNGFDDADADEAVNVYIPAIHGVYAGLPGFIEVQIEAQRPSIFGGIIGAPPGRSVRSPSRRTSRN